MRIIAGEKRGLFLSELKGEHTRPTRDRVREAIFSSIQYYVEGSEVLDLFAGTGAMGLEALSRGAKSADFVEIDKEAWMTLNANIKKTKYQDRANAFKADALSFLATSQKQYDLIFLDPPYLSGLYEKALEKIKNERILKNDGLIIVESKKNTLFLKENRLFLIHKEKNYGESSVTYLRLQEDMA